MRSLQHPPNHESSLQTVATTRRLLGSANFAARHKGRPEDFTRRRRLDFMNTVVLLLQKTVRSAQLHLNEFFERLGGSWFCVSASAWSQARLKLSHTAFVELNEQAILAVVYGPESRFARRDWRGHRLVAIDSSLLTLPNVAAMGQEFGWVECRNQKGACGRYVQGRLSVLTDVCNRIALQTLLVPWAQGERTLVPEHLAQLAAGDVGLLDRGYAGYELFARFIAAGRHFVCRCGGNSFGAVNRLLAADRAGESLCVSLCPPNGTVGEIRRLQLPERITVRLVTVRLSTGELEVLATTLLDEQKYAPGAFAEVYGYRWGIETYYGLLKSRLDLENFSGYSVEAVRQDVYATVFLSNLESILTAPVQQAMAAAAAPEPSPKINRAVSFPALKNHLIELLLSRAPAAQVILQLQAVFRGNPVYQRPGRQVPRTKLSAWRSYRFQRNTKKTVF
jgi:hypothetical protein